MEFTELRKKTIEQIRFDKEYTIDEFIKMVKSAYKSKYSIKSIKTNEELILLFIYRDLKVLGHVQTYSLNQFKK